MGMKVKRVFWMGHRYGQRFSLKGLGAIPIINGF